MEGGVSSPPMSMSAENPELNAALERLYRRHTFGIKLGLHVELALLARLGNPQRGLVSIHVAGTNGKGSVCALLDSILQAAGYRTGRYTSPHLIRFNERIGVNGQPITDSALLPLVAAAEAAAAAVSAELGQEPTFFEVTTAMAFQHFREQAVEVVLLETGMGGRLDATNVVDPLVSVITTIGLDHTQYLGDDLECIAREKCGIIKPGRPVVSGVRDEPARTVIRRETAEQNARLVEAWDAVSVLVKSRSLTGQKVVFESAGGMGGTLNLPLVGPHQVDNLAVALATLEVVGDLGALLVEPEAVRRGVAQVSWPGRFQVVGTDPVVILDGAHNPAAAVCLARTLRELAPDKPVGMVCGFCGDKAVREYLHALVGPVQRAWFVPIASERNMAPAELRTAAAGLRWEIVERDLIGALREAQAWAKSAGGVVCITGSLFLVGEVLQLIERGEWGNQGAVKI